MEKMVFNIPEGNTLGHESRERVSRENYHPCNKKLTYGILFFASACRNVVDRGSVWQTSNNVDWCKARDGSSLSWPLFLCIELTGFGWMREHARLRDKIGAKSEHLLPVQYSPVVQHQKSESFVA
jgi:hypothetical protein